MIHDSAEDEIAARYFTFVNDVAGVLAIALSASALQFPQPEPFAAFFFAVMALWVISRVPEQKVLWRSYMNRYRGIIGWVALAWRMNIFLLGYVLLFYIAIGEVTQQGIIDAWPF